MSKLWILCILLSYGCTQSDKSAKTSSYSWHEISGRDEGNPQQRIPIYHAKVPSEWIRQDPSAMDSIADTMKPICEYFLNNDHGNWRLTIHSFPSNSMHDRIAPAAQIARWKQQFDQLDLTDVHITPVAAGGYTGLNFEGIGNINNTLTKVIGWSMQMAPEQYQNLQGDTFNERHRRADYTIKVQGSPKMMAKHRDEVYFFANSFELIEEIPTR
jgi:hypothetical protein